MAPFPSRRHARQPSNSLLPTFNPPASSSSSSTTSLHSYPPPPSPSVSPRASLSSSTTRPAFNPDQKHLGEAERTRLFGSITCPLPGQTGGLGGITDEAQETVTRCLQHNHLHSHTFFNDDGFHNHCAHHLLAAYSLGGTPELLEDILKLHLDTAFKPMPSMMQVQIHEGNWKDYLGDERYYPNYLSFFHRLLSTPPLPTSPYYLKGHRTSTIPIIEHYLFSGQGDMLLRCLSGAIHPLIHIGHGAEFGLDGVVAEGLAQCAVTSAKTGPLFLDLEQRAEGATWPPQPPKPSGFTSTLTSAFSSLRLPSFPSSPSYSSSSTSSSSSPPQLARHAASYLPSPTRPIASGLDSFSKTCSNLSRTPGEQRFPREGLSGFTILDRMLHDPALAPGRACRKDDMPKLDAVLNGRHGYGDEAAGAIRRWSEEWKFSTQVSANWEEGAGRDSDDDDEDGNRNGGGGGEKAEKRRRALRGKLAAKGYGSPSWEEIVEKYEELVWISTVIYAASSRPGYRGGNRLDFFLMHTPTSLIFLPPLLQSLSPHLRPYLLISHFRTTLGYWVSRGRPPLFIAETLMAATARPTPPPGFQGGRVEGTAVRRAREEKMKEKRSEERQEEGEGGEGQAAQDAMNDGFVESPLTPKAVDGLPLPSAEHGEGGSEVLRELEEGDGKGCAARTETGRDEGSNAWMTVLRSAVDSGDEHVTKVIRSLFFAATHFGSSPKGMWQSSLRGTSELDGSVFIRAAGITLSSMGWQHEGDSGNPGEWDRSGLGFPESWSDSDLLPGHSWPSSSPYSGKGKERASASPAPSPYGSPPSNRVSPDSSPYASYAPSFASPAASREGSPAPGATGARGYSRSRSGTIILNSHAAGSNHTNSTLGSSTSSSTSAYGASPLPPPVPVLHRAPTDVEITTFTPSDSALLSPRLATSFATVSSRSSSAASSPRTSFESSHSNRSEEKRQGWRKVGEQVSEQEEREREMRRVREEEERELMA